MLILSRANIEELANGILLDFYGTQPARLRPVDIDRLASDYLGLTVRYEDLSQDGHILGVTSYARCKLKLAHTQIDLRPSTVLLDRSLMPNNKSSCSQIGRRRFTLAHECAHQILYRYESAISQEEICRPYACRQIFSLRELKSCEDWNEWQANALGASLLLPEHLLKQAMFFFTSSGKLTHFGGAFPPEEYKKLDSISRFLGVSHTALLIRLKQLGFLEERGAGEYQDPRDAVS